jgi:uncharacterized protein with GYD domain
VVFVLFGSAVRRRGKGGMLSEYLFEASYTAEGVNGLEKEQGTSRQEAVKKRLQELGGTLECMYFPFGDVDVYSNRRPARPNERRRPVARRQQEVRSRPRL